DALEPRRDFANRFAPRDTFEAALALLADAPLRIEHAVRVIDAFEVVGDLLTEEAAGERMVAVAAELDGSAGRGIDGDDHPAGVGAIVRADGLNGPEFAAHVYSLSRSESFRSVTNMWPGLCVM